MCKYLLLAGSILSSMIFSGCQSSRCDVILTKNGLSDYYLETFTAFRNNIGDDRLRYCDAILSFFWQFESKDLEKDLKKNPFKLTKKAVHELLGNPEKIDAYDPNHFIYLIEQHGENTQFYVVIVFKDGFFDEIYHGSSTK